MLDIHPRNCDHNGEIFLRIFIPEIFSEILRYLGYKERLSLRLCNRAASEAVARSDLKVIGREGRMRINGCYKEFTISIGDLILKRKFEEELNQYCKNMFDQGLRDLLRVKERLFARAYVESVEIININFNSVAIEYIESVLKGCYFKEITISIKRKEFSKDVIELIRKCEDKKINLVLKRFLIDIGTLLSFNFLHSLQILKRNSVCEEMLLELVKKRHNFVEIPVEIKSERFLLDLVETMDAHYGTQHVDFKVEREVADRLLMAIGYRRHPAWLFIKYGQSDFVRERISVYGVSHYDCFLQYGKHLCMVVRYPLCESLRISRRQQQVRFGLAVYRGMNTRNQSLCIA